MNFVSLWSLKFFIFVVLQTGQEKIGHKHVVGYWKRDYRAEIATGSDVLRAVFLKLTDVGKIDNINIYIA